jgi:hypothetical protein
MNLKFDPTNRPDYSQHPSHGKVVFVLWAICGFFFGWAFVWEWIKQIVKYAVDAWGM